MFSICRRGRSGRVRAGRGAGNGPGDLSDQHGRIGLRGRSLHIAPALSQLHRARIQRGQSAVVQLFQRHPPGVHAGQSIQTRVLSKSLQIILILAHISHPVSVSLIPPPFYPPISPRLLTPLRARPFQPLRPGRLSPLPPPWAAWAAWAAWAPGVRALWPGGVALESPQPLPGGASGLTGADAPRRGGLAGVELEAKK